MSPVALEADRFIKRRSGRTLRRGISSLDHWKHTSEEGLEGVLSATLLAADKDLRHVVDEVDDLSKALKSDTPEEQTARVVLHPAVWCAVRQTLLERELRYLALTDDLTSLYNKRGFFASAVQQLKLARRIAQVSSLFICGINYLNKTYDSLECRAGDLSLIRIADVLQQTFRSSDILARLDRDEFAVLASEASTQNHPAILGRLNANLKKARADKSQYGLSMSVGGACFDPQKPISLGELIAQADQNMHEQRAQHLIEEAHCEDSTQCPSMVELKSVPE